jgi:hypothetical protein
VSAFSEQRIGQTQPMPLVQTAYESNHSFALAGNSFFLFVFWQNPKPVEEKEIDLSHRTV